jgi:Ca2+-binding EF-hand superfamily protein
MKRIGVILMLVSFLAVPAFPCWADEQKDHVCFRAMDADNDGKVTFQEFGKYYGDDKAKFSAADLDEDGHLTHDEYHDLLGHGSL